MAKSADSRTYSVALLGILSLKIGHTTFYVTKGLKTLHNSKSGGIDRVIEN